MLPPDLAAVDEWASKQEDRPSRPEAIRRLVEMALERQPELKLGRR
jgi:hypothetical protein